MKSILIRLSVALFFVSGGAEAQDFKTSNTSFRDLYNDFRVREVTPTPWAGNFWPYGSNGIADREDRPISPSEKYDRHFAQGSLATDFEKEEHSCKNVDRSFRKGCREWWGHCNAWAAAAIKEAEPREPVTAGPTTFEVADLKAYLTEIWMSSDSLFLGDTNKSAPTKKSWVCDPDHPTSQKLTWGGSTSYEAFWDISPRDFFLIFTNYIGMRNESLVLDRFTGDQVWNQPVVAYRIHELKDGVDFGESEDVGSKSLYPVRLKATIYWANDSVEGSYLAEKFDLERADQLLSASAAFKKSYAGRTIGFTLFLNAPIKMEENRIVSAGKIVGQGIWDHQRNCHRLSAEELDDGHPDFVWRPTHLTPPYEANPHIESARVYQLVAGAGSSTPGGSTNPAAAKRTYQLKFPASDFPNQDLSAIKRAVKKVLSRAGIANTVFERSITANSRTVDLNVIVEAQTTDAAIQEAFAEAGYSIRSVTLL